MGWENYRAIFTDDGIINFTGLTWANLTDNRFFWLGGTFLIGGLVAGLIAEIDLQFAYLAAAAMAFVAASIGIFLRFGLQSSADHAVVSQVASPADP